MTIGLLYGEGDFKKSVLTATRCGDDTDCTAGTVGAFLGILYGADGIPADWKQYIGDRIVTCSLNAEYGWRFPKTCEELTRRVMKMMPAVFLANESEMEWTDTGKTVLDKARETKGRVPLLLEAFLSGKASPFSVGLPGCFFVTGYVSYSDAPVYAPQKELKATVRLYNKIEEYMWITPEIRVPDGWETTQPSSVLLPYTYRDGKENEFTFTLKMGDCPGTRKVLLVLRTPSHPKPLMAELSF
ncbi:MAG: ADP-ribosylglycohydrolase family protein [Clostridia bacterium]|nr:ADP-ribosylglycohydrolase family protein [Clostridia bacterium]